ncbi:hypothetical protein BAE44_0006971 [Dichanthelium oligosanthes]|uniref:NB-ARC domain-containing protein n=1 Tax=Dichanthelium oligosanthes TaxID=888268 RepID=A0A1E5W3N5_9POAL|nr:hypothetical protein BAE44_0006971 [Dichanthelium oligosanthes]
MSTPSLAGAMATITEQDLEETRTGRRHRHHGGGVVWLSAPAAGETRGAAEAGGSPESVAKSARSSTNWVNRVRELSNDIEDWADLFGLFMFRALVELTMHLAARRAISNELHDFMDRACVLSNFELPRQYNLGHVDSFALHIPRRSLISHDGPIEERLREEFDRSIFVSVGQERDMARQTPGAMLWMLQMARQVDDDMSLPVEMGLQRSEDIRSQLTRKLRESLQKKRYLILVDDIWSRGSLGKHKVFFTGEQSS